MKFLTYRFEGREYPGILSLDSQAVLPLSAIFPDPSLTADMNAFIAGSAKDSLEQTAAFLSSQAALSQALAIRDVTLTAPIKRPRHDILCVGVNYSDHIKEATDALHNQQLAAVTKPVFFSKRAFHILGDKEPLTGHFSLDDELDYEVELAIILGRSGKNIPAAEAYDYIFGYSVFNDYSSRRLQREHSQWLKGKSLDGYTALGPYIVTPDEFDPQDDPFITARVNQKLRQHSSIRHLIHPIPEIISSLSAEMTLEAGDIIATGTPSGVGMSFKPPKYLKPGDVVECEIEGLGKLTNFIISDTGK